ncbi:MAG: 2OG-Fe(II) oxygenase [Flavobacteriaceae bacterium]
MLLAIIFAHFFGTPMGEELFEQLDFVENPLFESIIEDLQHLQYSVVDGFFSEAEVVQLRNQLLLKYEEDRFKKSAIGNQFNEEIDKTIRGDFILWMDESKADIVEQLFFKKINELVHYLNKTCFLGIFQKEFHYALYPQGTFYKRHLDTFQNDDRRKLSIVCYLNEAHWPKENGGELTLYLETGALDVLPLPGRLVIFESQVLEHEVKIVKTSERLSITGWLKTR